MTTCARAHARAGSHYPFLTAKERDVETGLDYFGSRYYGSMQGLFTSTDPLLASAERGDPQTWNRYAYVTNNPLGFNDPSGERRNPVTGRRGIDPTPRPGTKGGVRANGTNPHVGEWGMTRSGGKKGHFGTDITSSNGTNLVAMEAGVVTEMKTAPKGGLQVHVKMADGSVYQYYHLSAVASGIKKGVSVQEGQIIATSGNSGNAISYAGTPEEHVHVTVLDANGANVNPVEWLNDPNADAPVDVLSTTGTPPPTPTNVPAGSPNQQTITGPNGSVTVQQQPLPPGQPHKHKPPIK